MGCCTSSPNDKKLGERIWYMPWKRRPLPPQEVVPPPSGYVTSGIIGTGNSITNTIDRGGGTYEKTLTQSDMSGASSHLADAPIYVCVWEYKAGSNAELSIRQGDKFRVIGNPNEKTDPDWLFVMRHQLGDRRWTGYIPKAKVALEGSMDAQPWYFGLITVKQAEDLLKSQPDGSFLVRKREKCIVDGKKPNQNADEMECVGGRKAQSEFTLSVKHGGRVVTRPIYQYLEAPCKDAFFLTRHNPFDNLSRLIEYFSMADSNFNANKLPCHLKSCPPKPEPGRAVKRMAVQANWREIPRSQIQLGQVKGDGHFGVVYEAKWTTPDGKTMTVAVKALRKGSDNAKRKFLEEAATMKNLAHKHLVKLFGIVSENEPFWIITEFVKDGSLLAYLQKRKSAAQLLPEKTSIDVCAQISDAMQYLEEKKVVHRDLAARNVLVEELTPGSDPKLLIKVTDFGLAKLIDPTKDSESKARGNKKVPTKWTAPEVLLNTNAASTASDVWSFGVVVHEVFSHGLEPYGILLHPAVREFVVVKRGILRKHDNVPERVYEMMKKCFSYEPKQRPTFKEVHSFFRNYYA